MGNSKCVRVITMTRPGCGKKTKKGKRRKHTPIVSEAQQGAMGSAYGAKKAGKGKPPKTPAAIWEMPKAELKRHLEESAGKDLPEYVRQRKAAKRKRVSR